MSDDKFDAIVVGAGVAGTVAAYVMAKAGLDVLVIERGNSAGSKNMTGGRLYAHSIESIMPGFATSAPIERVVTREKISFLTEESAVTLDFHRAPPTPPLTSYTVLRNKLDPWLMAQAEQAGAQFIPGVRVDALVREGNRVTGVQAGDDILDANIVILADGVNSMLGRSLDMVPVSSAHHYAVGVKELIGLSPLGSLRHLLKSALIWRPMKAPPGYSLARPPTGSWAAGFFIPTAIRFLWGWYVAWATLLTRPKAYRKCWKILNSIRRYAL